MVIDLFVVLVAGLFAFHSGRLLVQEYALEILIMGTVPSWLVQLVIPLAFAVIALRYLLFSVTHARELMGGLRQR